MEQTEQYFRAGLLADFERVGADLADRYAPVVEHYRQVVIPFETQRLSQHQSLVFENSSLQKDKMDLLGKIEQLKAQNDRMESALQTQQLRIHQLQRRAEEDAAKQQMLSDEITAVRTSNQEYVQTLERRDADLKQVERDKQVLLEKFDTKSSDYNILLANYMSDKNMLAEKLNQMNELEQNILEKERDLQAERFYLEKQWEELKEAESKGYHKSITPQPTPKQPKQPKQRSQIFGAGEGGKVEKEEKVAEKNPSHEVLRSPLKKVVKHHQSEIYEMSFNYNGTTLASCGGDRLIKIFDTHHLRASTVIPSHAAESIFVSVALNYGGERLLAGSTDRKVYIFQTEGGKLLHSFPGHGDRVNAVSWSSSKEKCVSGSEDKQLKIWDIEKASNIFSISCGKTVKTVTSNNVEPVVYSGHGDGSVRVYSITKGNTPVSQVKGLIDFPISSVTLMSNRHQVLVSSLEGSSLQLLDLKMNKSIGRYEHNDFFNSAARGSISPSEALVLAGNCDGSIYYWNRYKGDFARRVGGHDGSVTALNFNFMSSTLASADKEGSLILWQ